MNELTRDSVVSRAPDLMAAPVGQDVMLMSVAQGNYYALDPVAAAVWERIETPTTVATLCTSLAGQFDVSAEQCEADVLAFLEELRTAKLLVVG